jgi:putative ABC transport system permease protein
VRHDLQSILRGLRRFAALAVLTFALGISAATAIFTVVNRVVLNPVPYPNPDRIVYLGWSWTKGSYANALSARKFEFWREQTHQFDGVTTYAPFTSDSGIRGLRVSTDFFRVIGSRPVLGRAFTLDETQRNGPPVAILSYGLWESRYGLDPRVLNSQIRVDKQIYTIVGVMPATFRIAEAADQAQILLPLVFTEAQLGDKGNNYLVAARLKPRVTLSQARADVAAVMERFRTAYPGLIEPNDVGVTIEDYQKLFLGNLRTAIWVLFGATGFLLVLTCANVANLLLSRALRRRREIAIRTALGATSGRLVRLFVTEGVILGLLAAVIGVAVSVWGLHALLALAPQMLPVSEEPRPDGSVLAFSASLALLTGGLVGLVHAVPTLKTHKYQGRLPGTLIAIESALAIVLLAGAGLLMTSLAHMLAIDTGYLRRGVVIANFPRVPAGYDSAGAVWTFDQRVLERLRAMPGVQSAASATVARPRTASQTNHWAPSGGAP